MRLRPLREDDFEALYAAAADPLIWAQHPAKDRHERAVFEPYFAFLLASATTLAVEDAESGQIVGCSRFYETPPPQRALSIGFTFLTRAHWGGIFNYEMKRLMLNHIFATRAEAWFHIDPANIRSQRATEKLGAVFVGEEELDLGTGTGRWRSYRLLKDDWTARL
ncbi:MAG: GNAT family N-acetyltransferase [Pseudomonadota bacterium]